MPVDDKAPVSDDATIVAGRSRLMWVGALIAIGLLFALLWWLLSSGGQVEWAKTTVPYDPACATDCEVVGMITPGHRGPTMPVAINPHVDDPIAQWAVCIDAFTQCMEVEHAPLACMAKGTCPNACKSAYDTEASQPSDLEGQLRVFQEMFLNEGAYCRPTAEAGQ